MTLQAPRTSMVMIERLTLRAWLTCVLPWLVRARLRGDRSVERCWVIDGGRASLTLARATGRALGCGVEPLVYRLVDVRDEKGQLIRLRVPYEDLRDVQAAAMEEPVFREFERHLGAEGRLGTYVAKGIARISLTEPETLWRALLLVQVATWKLRHDGGVDEAVLFLERRPWFRSIVDYASRYGVTVTPCSPAVDVRELMKRLGGPRGAAIARWLRSHWYVLRNRVACGPRDAASVGSGGSGPGSTARVCVKYSGYFNLSRRDSYSDLFFWQESSVSSQDLLMAFVQPHDPLDEAKWAELAAHGVRAVVVDGRATRLRSAPLFLPRPSFGPGYRRARLYPGLDPGVEGQWLQRQAETYRLIRDYWYQVFAAHGVKIFLDWFYFDAEHCAIGDAVRQSGGVLGIYQRALQRDATPEIATDADVMFGYAPGDVDVHARSGSRIPYHISVGYLGDHLVPLVRPTAQALRAKLQQRGVKYVVAYFDEASGEDSRWHTGHEFQRENYAFLLERLLSEQWLGLVVKPKVPSSLRRRLGPVAKLLSEAEATNRCHVYEGGVLHGTHPPAVAARAADVAVHGHLCAGTAGFEAALAGVPTLLLDREGWPASPLYQLGVGRVVFTTWEDLWGAIVEHRARPGGFPGFGDWSPLLADLDPFRDGRAAERMGTYVMWLVEAFKHGHDREAALAAAAERYCAQWGQDKVNEVRPHSWPSSIPAPPR